MTIDQAFNHLLSNWINMSPEFRQKFKVSKSKFDNKKSKGYYVGDEKKREMLQAAGYIVKPEVWKLPK